MSFTASSVGYRLAAQKANGNIVNHGVGTVNGNGAHIVDPTEGTVQAPSPPPTGAAAARTRQRDLRQGQVAARRARDSEDPADTTVPFPAADSETAGPLHPTDCQQLFRRDSDRTNIKWLVIELPDKKRYHTYLGVPAFDGAKNFYTRRDLKFRELTFEVDPEED
ncbi:hypothetical protein HPB52_000460 [Rhipicephalus sanguineus]|uniref:Uncharacterized protein n=1 Tax=Rhipicephalus sanguineus TaxID=34632 RepID=A0A9D4T848_RHISA|nr:hypothetical protein HPB52_000460 [Rhipicephalus sanguineus]